MFEIPLVEEIQAAAIALAAHSGQSSIKGPMPKTPLAPNAATVSSSEPVLAQSDGTVGSRLSPISGTGNSELASSPGRARPPRPRVPSYNRPRTRCIPPRVAVRRRRDRQAQRERRCQQAKPVRAGIDQNVVDGLALRGTARHAYRDGGVWHVNRWVIERGGAAVDRDADHVIRGGRHRIAGGGQRIAAAAAG